MAKKTKKEKKMIVRVLALVLAILMVLGACVSAIYALADGAETYDFQMYYHEDNQAFEIVQTLTYRNDTGQPLASLRFSLYQNAFRRLTTSPFLDDELYDAYPAGFAPGGVDFVSVNVNGEPANWGVSGDGEEFLRVDCDLAPGSACEFTFYYYVLLPECAGRSGAGDTDVRLSYFYPVAAVWDDGAFVVNELYALGDSLYSDVSSYTVSLNVPATYRVAATGTQTEEPLGDNRKIIKIEAEARAFALAMSRKYSIYSGERATVYAVEASDARRALEYADKILAVYEELFGALPFGVDVAQTSALSDASYPGLVWLTDEQMADDPEWTLARLLAKQYFGCLVGNDPVANPFLSDSLCEYAALLYFEDAYGYDTYLDRLNELCLPALQTEYPSSLTVDGALYAFSARVQYDAIIRARGCAVLHEMRALMGADKLRAGLRLYVSRMANANAHLSDFAAALDDAAGQRWDEALIGQMRSIGEYAKQQLDRYE